MTPPRIRMEGERLTAAALPLQAGTPGDRRPVEPAKAVLMQPAKDGVGTDQRTQRIELRELGRVVQHGPQLLVERPWIGRVHRARATGHLLPPSWDDVAEHVRCRPVIQVSGGVRQPLSRPVSHQQSVAREAAQQAAHAPSHCLVSLDAFLAERVLDDVVVIDAGDALVGPVRRRVAVAQGMTAHGARPALLQVQALPLGRREQRSDVAPDLRRFPSALRLLDVPLLLGPLRGVTTSPLAPTAVALSATGRSGTAAFPCASTSWLACTLGRLAHVGILAHAPRGGLADGTPLAFRTMPNTAVQDCTPSTRHPACWRLLDSQQREVQDHAVRLQTRNDSARNTRGRAVLAPRRHAAARRAIPALPSRSRVEHGGKHEC